MLFLPEGSQELKERVRGHDDDDDDDGDDDDDDDDDNDDGDGVWMRRLNTQHKTLMIQMLRIFSGTVSLMYMFLTTSWGEDGSWKRSQIIGVWIGLSSCLKAVFRSDLIHVPGRDPELQCEPSLWDKRRKIWEEKEAIWGQIKTFKQWDRSHVQGRWTLIPHPPVKIVNQKRAKGDLRKLLCERD